MFIVSPYNSLRFAKRDSLLPNYDNQLHSEREQTGLLVIPYCQIVNNGDAITIQIRSDYDGAITATLIDNSDASETTLTVTEEETYSSFSTYEFTYSFPDNGNFSIRVNGADSVQDSVVFLSEPIAVAAEHENTLLVEYYNETNTEYIDYSTGIQHMMRLPARIPDAEHDTDENIYDNQNRDEKTYSATKFKAEFATNPLPEYIVRQLTLAQGLFNFFINDKQYIGVELSSERFNLTTSQQVTLECTEYQVAGVNDDDSQPTIETTDDMNTYPLNKSITANDSLNVPAGYMVDTIIYSLASGSSATIKAGLTVSGDEILSERSLTTASPVSVTDREYLGGAAQYESAFTVYLTVTGVSVQIDVNIIIKKYIEV